MASDTTQIQLSATVLNHAREAFESREQWQEDHEYRKEIIWPTEDAAALALLWTPRAIELVEGARDEEAEKALVFLDFLANTVEVCRLVWKVRDEARKLGHPMSIDFEELRTVERQARAYLVKDESRSPEIQARVRAQ